MLPSDITDVWAVGSTIQHLKAGARFHFPNPHLTPESVAGRILNRFGKDFAILDSRLASSLQQVNVSLSGFFVAILTVTCDLFLSLIALVTQLCSVVFPPFLFPASIIAFLYWSIAVGYLNTGRDLRRMESNSRSPIFSDFGEMLTGIVTVRGQYSQFLHRHIETFYFTAFSAEKRFMESLHAR
jgi:ABC-type multidrug transport system fused ATPase/permease subunit